VLFLVFGSSGAGKTTLIDALQGRDHQLALHDLDEVGVPAGADVAWRHRALERYVRHALALQEEGCDLLLAGQTPFGELLATPSAAKLDGISACLLDCDHETTVARLRGRGNEWLDRHGAQLEDHLHWAEWLRKHADDPSWQTHVIKHEATEDEMCWERWSGWAVGDPRWRVHQIDTSDLSVESVADAVWAWVENERALARSGNHPLTNWVA